MSVTLAASTDAGWFHKLWFGSVKGSSIQAADTEWLYMFILWVNIISFIVLMALMGYFVVKYHRSKQARGYQVSASHNTPLELAWSIIPLLIMVPIFYWGFQGYVDKLAAPSDAEELYITGRQWQWDIRYRNGAEPQSDLVYLTKVGRGVPEFVVPVDRPVRLVMRSVDVLHAFYIPDFRTKMDVIPNRFIGMWFQANKLGSHNVFCAEYCGQDHSEMAASLKVVTMAEYTELVNKWLGPPSTGNPIDFGKVLWARKGCNACHSIDGTKSTGPTWKDMYGAVHNYTNGERNKTVDENWLRENILYSQKRTLETYPGTMPVFAGQLSELDVDALVFYIKSLSSKATPEELAPGKKTYAEINAEKAQEPKK